MVAATGALAGKTRRALDSTVLDDVVATQDTVTQLIGAIRRVGREVPGAAQVIAATIDSASNSARSTRDRPCMPRSSQPARAEPVRHERPGWRVVQRLPSVLRREFDD